MKYRVKWFWWICWTRHPLSAFMFSFKLQILRELDLAFIELICVFVTSYSWSVNVSIFYLHYNIASLNVMLRLAIRMSLSRTVVMCNVNGKIAATVMTVDKRYDSIGVIEDVKQLHDSLMGKSRFTWVIASMSHLRFLVLSPSLVT